MLWYSQQRNKHKELAAMKQGDLVQVPGGSVGQLWSYDSARHLVKVMMEYPSSEVEGHDMKQGDLVQVPDGSVMNIATRLTLHQQFWLWLIAGSVLIVLATLIVSWSWIVVVEWVAPFEFEEFHNDTYPLRHNEDLEDLMDLWWGIRGRNLFVLTEPRIHRWGSVFWPPDVEYEDLQDFYLFRKYPEHAFEITTRMDWVRFTRNLLYYLIGYCAFLQIMTKKKT